MAVPRGRLRRDTNYNCREPHMNLKIMIFLQLLYNFHITLKYFEWDPHVKLSPDVCGLCGRGCRPCYGSKWALGYLIRKMLQRIF
jgi:hypothetical protein